MIGAEWVSDVRGSVSHRTSQARAWIGASDVRMLLAMAAGLYALFGGFSLLLGLDANGTLLTLERVTFFAAVYAMAVLALNLQWGYAGLFNIGVAGFMAIGVYTLAVLSRSPSASPPGFGLPLWFGILGGVVVAAGFGAIVALPALRLRADYLAIVTLAFAEIVRSAARSRALDEISFGGIATGFGGRTGMSLPADPMRHVLYADPADAVSAPSVLGEQVFHLAEVFGIRQPIAEGVVYAAFLLVVLGGFYWLLWRIGKSPFGRVLKAIREDELAASALGKDVRRFKIQAFALGAGLMGLAAILWYIKRGGARPTNFRPEVTFFIFVALIIGGSGSNTGSVIGGAFFASVLFEGPIFVRRIIAHHVSVGRAPETIFGAFENTDQFLAYVLADENMAALRVVLLGVLLVYVIQRRPTGLLGHRRETAASIDLARPDEAGGQP